MVSPTSTVRRTLAGHKRTLETRLKTAQTQLQQPFADTQDAATEQQGQLSILRDSINKSIEKITTVDAQYVDILERIEDEKAHETEETLYTTVAIDEPNGYQRLVEVAETTVLRLEQYMNRLEKTANVGSQPYGPSPNGSGDTHGHANNQQIPSFQPPALHLPKLSLPTFNGDILKFPEFWSIFDAAIHSRSDLSPVAKLSYLLPQLEGIAAQAIQGYQHVGSNYDLIVTRLKERFERSGDRYISMLHAELKRIPTSSTRFPDRRKTLDACERIFRQLEQAGQTLDPGQSLVFDLLSKFPPRTILDLDRRYGVGVYSPLSEVRNALEKSMSEEELTSGFLNDLIGPKKNNGSKTDNRNIPGNHEQSNNHKSPNQSQWQESTLSTQAQQWSQRQPMTTPPESCYFCSGNHFNDKCDKYRTARARMERLEQLGRCKRCMRSHTGRQCQISLRCYFCKRVGNHCSPLCSLEFPDKSDRTYRNDNTRKEQSQGRPPRTFTRQRNSPTPKEREQVHLAGEAYGSPPVEQHDDEQPTPESPDPEIANLSSVCTKNSLFQTAKVTAFNPSTGEQHRLRICLDTLSNRSYITNSAAQLLNLQSDREDQLCISVFGTNKNVEVKSRLVSLGLTKSNGQVCTIQANTTRIISNSVVLPRELPPNEHQILSSLRHCLADDPFDDNKSVDILIGADYAWDIIEGSKTPLQNCNIFLIPSVFGFMLGGQLHYEQESDNGPTLLCITETHCQFPGNLGLLANDSQLHTSYPDVDEFWNLETIGIKDCPVEKDDDLAQDMFDRTVFYQDGRYHVQWPWIPEKKALLPTNYGIALGRFKQLTHRLAKDPKLLHAYRETIQMQVDRDIIERVPSEEVETENPTHYLPHHPVVKPNRATTKVRVVYDASCKEEKNSVSLNDCLLRGPVLLPDLCALLIRFRISRTVVTSDVEKAFLQVALQLPDRDVTRFLWFRDDNNPSTDPSNMITMRFCRVAFGIISSPFLLGATIRHHLRQEGSEFAQGLFADIYVDNIISGLPNDMPPLEYYNKVKELFARAGMNVQQFCSNSKELMQSIPTKDLTHDFDTKILGIRWDSQGDDSIRLIRPARWDKTVEQYSKRSVLRCIASIFDPLGMFQPVTFPAKIFLQSLWEGGIKWDEKLSDSLVDEWNKLRTSLDGVFDIRVPRVVDKVEAASTLVVFSDASPKGYGAAVYLRSPSQVSENEFSTHLLFAKSRLAPVPKSKSKKQGSMSRPVTVPRLELLGVTIAVKAVKFCRQALNIPDIKIHVFTDSECVLHWIRGDRLLKRFVANRIEQIQSLDNCIFHYVGTEDNPADFLTRGLSSAELKNEAKWWKGPSWLSNPVNTWPQTRLPPITSKVLQECKQDKPVTFVHALATNTVPGFGPFGISFNRFSSLMKFIKTTWYCLRFLQLKIWNNLSRKVQQSQQFLNSMFQDIDTTFTSDAYQSILRWWVEHVQAQHFSLEIKALQQRKFRPLIKQLNLQLDEHGLLRTHSRYDNADLPRSSKHPVLLPKNQDFSRLIVLEVHKRLQHAGPTHTLSEVRNEFWIPHGREFVKKVLKSCPTCRRYRTAQPFQLPSMPPWPAERVSRSAPFQYVGVDYFGPLKVKVYDMVKKMWGCIFTCLSTRAVHIESVVDCTPSEFLQSLSRFVSRRGSPEEVISDNAAQFQLTKILGDRAWKTTPSDDEMISFAAQHGFQWKFIVELAPWQGGHYERLIGVVKSFLKTAVGRRLLTWSDLVTLLAETEAIVNSRPITYVNNEHDSGYRILRPVDFLLYRPINSLPISDTSFPVRDLGEGSKILAALWKHREKYLNKLWSIWYDEYLLSLRERASIFHKSGRARMDRVPVVGEVVIVREENTPRGSWKLARITTLIYSADSKVRAAEITLANGVKLRRAISFLIPLETSVVKDISESDSTTTQEENEPIPTSQEDTEPIPASTSDNLVSDSSQDKPNQVQRDSHPTVDTQQSEESDLFGGFSQEDIQRTEKLLQMYDDALNEFDQ